MTPIGSRESLMRPCSLRHGDQPPRRPRPRLERLRVAGDLDHVVLRDPLQQRVRDPVDRVLRLPRDEPDPVAVLEDHQLAPAHVADLGRALDDRRVHPRGALDAVVLAEHAAVYLQEYSGDRSWIYAD